MKTILLLIFTTLQLTIFAQLSIDYDEENNEICLDFDTCDSCLLGEVAFATCECRESIITEYSITEFSTCRRQCKIDEIYEDDFLICVENCEQNYGIEAFINSECGNAPSIPEIINVEYRIQAATAPLGEDPRSTLDNWQQAARATDNLTQFRTWNCLSLDSDWPVVSEGRNRCYWASMTIRYIGYDGIIQVCSYEAEICEIIG